MRFITPNHQILNSDMINSFWIEKTNKISVFCKDKNNETWNIAEFSFLEDAQEYLKLVFESFMVLEK